MTVTGRRDFPVFALSPQAFRQNEGPAARSLQAANPFECWNILKNVRLPFWLTSSGQIPTQKLSGSGLLGVVENLLGRGVL